MSSGNYDHICYQLDNTADDLIHTHKEPHVIALAKHLHVVGWADSGLTTRGSYLDDRIKKIVSKDATEEPK